MWTHIKSLTPAMRMKHPAASYGVSKDRYDVTQIRHPLGRRPVKGRVDFDCVEDLRVILKFIEPFDLHIGIKSPEPTLRR